MSIALGDIVEMNDQFPFFQEWKSIELKVVSLRIDPEGKQWVSTIDFEPGYLPRHRANGVYDSETTDIDAAHLSLIRSDAPAQQTVGCGESDELSALADEYATGLNKMRASGYEEYGPVVQRRHQLVIESLRAASWQPRGTAPKTGKPFLAFFPDAEFSPVTGMDVVWWEPSEQQFLIGGSALIWKFSHWKPLGPSPSVPSTDRLCAKCRCTTKGEEALVEGEIWCHPCADSAPSTQNNPDKCAKCGFPRAEHSYNGACYGLCGKFVSSVPSTDRGTP